MLYVSQYLPASPMAALRKHVRLGVTFALGLLWILSVAALAAGWTSATYLALIGIWALPPIMLQTGFGADILWRDNRRVAVGLLPAVIYLSLADALAIRSGTWTINPDKSLNVYLGSILPIEEFVFFIATNLLIVFSVSLVMSEIGRRRVSSWYRRFSPSSSTHQDVVPHESQI